MVSSESELKSSECENRTFVVNVVNIDKTPQNVM